MKKALLLVILCSLLTSSVSAVPYFARKFDTPCQTCHTFPPHLNQFGLDFVARGYRMEAVPAHKTVPLAVWATQRLEFSDGRDFTKSFPNRIEIISGGEITDRISYFVEWRALSYQTTSPDGRLKDRSGRFEDLFLIFQLTDRFSLTAGQFRMLSQWDASRKLSLSTPVAFSASIGGEPALSSRISSLRSFSLQGRAPALRLSVGNRSSVAPADGWHHEFTVPFSGEISAPLTDEARDNASFELEGRPKGLFYESYHRRGLDTWGGGVFVGDDRWMANLVGQRELGQNHLYGSIGTARDRNDLQDFRLSLGHYWIPRPWFGFGSRFDHRSADGRGPAFVPHANFHFPGERYTLLFVVEPFLQERNSGISTELSFVF